MESYLTVFRTNKPLVNRNQKSGSAQLGSGKVVSAGCFQAFDLESRRSIPS